MVIFCYCAGVCRGNGSSVLEDGRGRDGGGRATTSLQRLRTIRSAAEAEVVRLVAFAAAADRDPAGARAGHGVPVAATERLLPGDILRGARHAVGGVHRQRRRTVLGHGRDGGAGRRPAADQRGGVRAVHARRTPAAAHRVVVGHGVLGRPGGADLRPDGRAAVAAGGRRGVRVQRLGRRARVPVDAGRRTVARLGPGRGRRRARGVRVHAHVCRAQGVPVRGGRRRRCRGHDVRIVRRRVAGHGRVRVRPAARDDGQAVRRDRSTLRLSHGRRRRSGPSRRPVQGGLFDAAVMLYRRGPSRLRIVA